MDLNIILIRSQIVSPLTCGGLFKMAAEPLVHISGILRKPPYYMVVKMLQFISIFPTPDLESAILPRSPSFF